MSEVEVLIGVSRDRESVGMGYAWIQNVVVRIKERRLRLWQIT